MITVNNYSNNMTFQETFFFIAKSLTINLEDRNKEEIEKQLQSNNIDWEFVVKVSTAHYVLPALYCNLQRSDFLHYLPEDLVTYMEYITDLNRKRNEEIILQVKELNKLLSTNNIKPVFLKGSGNLLAGIYEDIAERMVGDIDFLLSKKDSFRAYEILKTNNYYNPKNLLFNPPDHRHLPRLVKQENKFAAVEIHSEMLGIKKYRKEFNHTVVGKDYQLIDEVRVLSYANKLNLSIISDQINDNGFYYKMISLRNAYDVFLLSKKTNAKAAVNRFDKLNNPLNCFLSACYEIFNKIDSLEYNNTKMTASYLNIFSSQLANPISKKIRYKLINIYLLFGSILNIIYKSITNKEQRNWLLKRILSTNTGGIKS